MIIYKITNLINNKIYIGLTTRSLISRWKQHINQSHKSKCYISRSIKKYGKENFKIEKIDFAESEKELQSKESYWIAKYQSNNKDIGFNNTTGGELSIPNDIVIINIINSKSQNSNRNYMGIYWSEARKSWFAEAKYLKKSKRIRGFSSEIDAAIARDILICKLWKNSKDDFRSILNFPDNYDKYLNNEIKYPKRIIKRSEKKSKYHFVQWDKNQRLWYISILYGLNKENKFKNGMYSTEEEAAEVADYYNLMYLNDLKRINFIEKLDYYKTNYIPIKTVLQKRKTSPYRYISYLNDNNCYSVDVRLSKIRKMGFKTPEEAKIWRDNKLKELNIPIPD